MNKVVVVERLKQQINMEQALGNIQTLADVERIIDFIATDVPDTNVGKWIPVSERLPKDGQRVIVYDNSAFFGVAWRENNEWWADEFIYDDGDVTHWMPLPEPPKEVE